MTFKRNLETHLDKWKSNANRKPLIIRGARQVGKTTLIRDFAKFFAHSVTLNLEKPADRRYFEDFDNVQSLFEALCLAHDIQSSAVADMLLFIDEIQESPKAIQMLRYFYEEIPALHIITAGSLLEFAMERLERIPVGRVEYLYLYPLNFQEYLEAAGKKRLLEQLTQIPVKPIAHQALMDTFHRYAIIGGMPEIVKTDLKRNNLSDLPAVYESIWGTYKSDVEKYADSLTKRRIIRHIMDTAPSYVDQRVKFEGFGHSNYRSREMGEAFRMLDYAKIIRLIYPTTDLLPPLKASLRKSPRLQFLDTGVVNYSLGIQAEMLAMDDLNTAYKGAIIPHLITQELFSLQSHTAQPPKFWVREKTQSSAEVDLVYPYKGLTIPVAIKSGSTGSLRSLHQFVDAVDHHYAIRMYAGTFSIERAVTRNKKPYLLLNLPYYAGTVLPQYVEWLVGQKM